MSRGWSRPERRVLCGLMCALLLCAGPLHAAPGKPQGVEIPAFERLELPNGAVLLLMERHDVPLIAFHALLGGGALGDPPNQSGVASLLAGLLEKGAGPRDALAFAETVASVGGVIQTGAGQESLSVSGSFLARDRRLMVELLADLLQRPRLPADQFTALRARRIEFLRAVKDSDLAQLTPVYGAKALLGEHPYGRSVDGSEASLARIEHDSMRRYYDAHVGADRLVLAVVGDFATAEMKQLLTQAFAGWRKAAAAAPTPKPPQTNAARRVLLIDAPGSVQSYFWAGSLGVARKDPRRAALDVMNTLFGGRFTSMLNSELRVRTGLSYGASAAFDRMKHGGVWQMTSFTETSKTIEAIDLAFATLDKLHQGAVDQQLLASSQAYILGQFPLAFETSSQWAVQLASLEFYDLDRAYIEQYASAVAAVSQKDAQDALSALPHSDEVVLVVIGAAAAVRDGLRKYGPVTEMALANPEFAP